MSNGRGLGGRVSADRKKGGNFEETREGRKKRLERSIRVRKCILISNNISSGGFVLVTMGGEGGESRKKEKNQIGLQKIKWSYICGNAVPLSYLSFLVPAGINHG